MVKKIIKKIGLMLTVGCIMIPTIAFAASSGPTIIGDTQDAANEVVSGDFNGDGIQDLLQCTPNYPTSFDEGAIRVYYGGISGNLTPSDADIVVLGSAAMDEFGASCDNAGDTNGDDYDDIIVGAPKNDDNGSSSGSAYLIFGGPTLVSGDINSLVGSNGASQFTGNFALEGAGYVVTGAGDLDGDGYDDILIGAPMVYLPTSMAGSAYLYYGDSYGSGVITGLASPGIAVFNGQNPDDVTGSALANIGDFDGDGNEDIAIGAFRNDTSYNDAGVVYVVSGLSPGSRFASVNLASSMGVSRYYGEATQSHAGDMVQPAGDTNGDGCDDMLVGAPLHSSLGYYRNGGVYLVYGCFDSQSNNILTSSPATPQISIMFAGNKDDAKLGGTVHGSYGVSDLDVDGFDDFIIGQSSYVTSSGSSDGAAHLIYGKANFVQTLHLVDLVPGGVNIFTSGTGVSNFGSFIDLIWDMDSDGLKDILISDLGYITSSAYGEGKSWLFPASDLAAASGTYTLP